MRPPLEIPQVADFLRVRFGGDVQGIALLGQGGWSQAFSFSLGDRNLVARFGAHVEDFEKDRLASRFSTSGLPVPHVVEIGEALGGYFCISERILGEYLESLDVAGMREIVPAVCQMLGALRATDLGDSRGFGGWDAQGVAPHGTWHEYLLSVDTETERVSGWHRLLEESPTGSTVFYEALAFLKAHLRFCPNERYLIHNDLLHGNVLVFENQISGVIDWGCGLYGDCLYDLAMFTYYAPWFPSMAGIDWASEARTYFVQQGIEISHFDERLRCCEVSIALGNMAYSAFRQNWGDLNDNARRLRARIAG